MKGTTHVGRHDCVLRRERAPIDAKTSIRFQYPQNGKFNKVSNVHNVRTLHNFSVPEIGRHVFTRRRLLDSDFASFLFLHI
jgi:hypothetical protein